jgi:hypothetical protein
MELSPREAISYSATEEFPNISWSPVVHCRAYKRPPLVPTLNHMNLIRNILILSFHLWGLVVSFLLTFLPKPYILSSLPTHPPWLDHSNYIWQKTPRAIFSTLLLFYRTWVEMFSSEPVFRHPQSMFFP